MGKIAHSKDAFYICDKIETDILYAWRYLNLNIFRGHFAELAQYLESEFQSDRNKKPNQTYTNIEKEGKKGTNQ